LSALGGRDGKCIQWVDNNVFAKKYKLCAKVMESTNTAMEVRYATRYSDRKSFVVKLRYKPRSFKTQELEKNWRKSTEFMLNLPRNKAVAHLHEHGWVHKDIKLENVVVAGEGKDLINSPSWRMKSVKLIDFDTVEEWSQTNPSLAKDVLGTNQYIAPEAYSGRYSPSSDVFALGVIGYRLLLGRYPFPDKIFDDKPGENRVGSAKMKEIRSKLEQCTVSFDAPVFQENPGAAYLLSRMLRYDEAERPTLKEALAHDWINVPGSPSTASESEIMEENAPIRKIPQSASVGSMLSFVSLASTEADAFETDGQYVSV
jgi:serine/threonine protein kinase